MKKSVLGVYPSPRGHWVGDGFPVRSLFSYDALGAQLSPFLLLDYAGPAHFAPAASPRGVGQHPHRGFETVTIVYQGEVAHRDSVGNSGVIEPGDVQWMTAASGILHEEFHAPAFTQAGGQLEMAQLWVNLPARHKMAPPRYQALLNAAIPSVDLQQATGAVAGTVPGTVPGTAPGKVRVIAGRYGAVAGPAATFSPMNVWDMRLKAGCTTAFAVPEGHTAAIALFEGRLSANGSRPLEAAELLVFGVAGEQIEMHAEAASTLLFLSGEPIAEPIVGHGPFVMNSRQEIAVAMRDFEAGRFGRMSIS